MKKSELKKIREHDLNDERVLYFIGGFFPLAILCGAFLVYL